ncbi:LysR family transcriptional regulator [Hafnia alvei]|nr:LysR family transcriptional regulator [Hafnia alvei]
MFEHQDSLKSLRKFDLNLLTVFEAVYFYKSVSKAADILGMTSPAVSQSIQRLR